MSAQLVPGIPGAWVSTFAPLSHSYLLPDSGQRSDCNTCCLTASAHISRVPPPRLDSPGKYLLTSKQSLFGRGAGGSRAAPSVLFPINFSPVAFAEALIMRMMIMRIFLCVAASRGVIPYSLLSSNLPEDQRVSSAGFRHLLI